MDYVVVSICIPTFKNPSAFERCLNSIINQTFPHYEIIITDDTPSNEIFDIVSSYNFKGKFFRYIKNKVNLGSPANWNEAIKYARGEYIKILHHDDWFTYNYSLELFVNLLKNNPKANLGFVSSKNVNTENGKTLNINSPSYDVISKIESFPAFLISGNFIGSPSATIFRKVNMQYFDENLIWLVDVEAYINILKTQSCFLSFNVVDAISIGISDLQITRRCEQNKQINIFEFFYVLNKYKDDFSINNYLFKSLISLIYKFNISSFSDIRKYYQGPLPNCLKSIFFIKRFFYKSIAKKILNILGVAKNNSFLN